MLKKIFSSFLSDIESQPFSQKKKEIKDITHIIERREDLEQRLSARFEGLFARINDAGELYVNGELHSTTEWMNGIYVVVSVHDDKGRTMGVGKNYFSQKHFYSMEAFSIYINLKGVSEIPSKIKVYPTGTG
ncbi:MAG: hypothetical protein ABRQ39_13620 [Candidatus Eremiobacterota bacterium]